MAMKSRASHKENLPRARKIPETRQLMIIHLSDIHFGPHHRFSSPPATGDGKLPAAGQVSLLESLRRDLGAQSDPGCPVILCLTGDFAETASSDEFREAEAFIKQLAIEKVYGKAPGLENIFIVPGNHDVAYMPKKPEDRWSSWSQFCSQTFNRPFTAREPSSRVTFHDRYDDLGAIIICFNSSEYVEKGTPDEQRGSIDEDQLTRTKAFLDGLDSKRVERAIRIALIHHHPILIPGLAEPGRGYDAVERSGLLLNMLRNFGFHVILHGHKHNPYHFSENSYTAFHEDHRPPILIVAGGSASSKQLPEGGFNTYNRIAIKWNPEARQGRIMLWTSALQTSKRGVPLLSSDWRWVTRLVDDRPYLGGPPTPQSFRAECRKFDSTEDGKDEARRYNNYINLRFNLPVCEVMPSLIPGQHNEVRLWIELHKSSRNKKEERPLEVTWSAGENHEVVTIQGNKDPRFCATLHYYGPMLVQAKLRFRGGHVAYGYVYARMPTIYPRPDRPAIDLG
jgi:3',5'-cyclic AMP phosphodiesterase CpdA